MSVKEEHLKKDQLNFFEVIALSIAIIAPTMAMAMNVGLMAGSVGFSVSLVFLISIVLMGFVAVSFVKFNQMFSSAGSVYTFVKKSLGDGASSVAGWLIALEYWGFTCGCSAVFGSLANIFVKDVFGVNISWLVFSILCGFVIWYLNYTDIKLSTNVMLIVEILSVLLVIFLAIVIIIKVGATHGLSLAPFKMGGNRLSALGVGMVPAVLSFAGFEGASSLGEESKNPKKYIPLAIASTVIGTGVIFVFVSYAQVLGFGTTSAGLSSLTQSASTVVDLSKQYIGPFFTNVINFGICISSFSCALGSMTAGSRALYAMGQDGFAPATLGRVHEKHATPHLALHIMLVGTLVVMFALSSMTGSAVYGVVATTGALAAMLAYLATSLGAIFLFGSNKIWTWELFFPIVSLLILGYCFYSNIYPVPSYPYNVLPYIVLVWVVLGVIITAVCRNARKKAGLAGNMSSGI